MIRGFILNVLSSFNTDKGGYSARKLSAFVSILMGGYVTGRYGDGQNVVELTMVWLSFALLLLGVVTIEQLVSLRVGRQVPGSDKKTEQM